MQDLNTIIIFVSFVLVCALIGLILIDKGGWKL